MHSRFQAALVILALTGCGDPPESANIDGESISPTKSSATSEQNVGPTLPEVAPPASPAPARLDEDTLNSWMEAMTDLREVGMQMSDEVGTDPNALKGYFAGLGFSEEWKTTLSAHGFTYESFQDVSHQVTRALAAVLMEDQKGTLEAATKQQLAAMKSLPGVTQKQLDDARAAMQESQAQVNELASGATEETKALIKRYRAKIEATFR